MRSAAAVIGLLVGSACGFQSKAAGSDAAPQPDACVSFSKQLDTCALALTADLTVSGMAKYDTTAHVLTSNDSPMNVARATLAAGAGDVDAILAHDVLITGSAQLVATGALPLAIVASGKVTIEEDVLIDVGHGGAGHRTSCEGGPTAGSNHDGGAGGGGGGGFGAAGGAGGNGNDGGITGGSLGAAATATPPGPLGGCAGASGGTGDVPGGAGGLGGGAIYIVAAGGIELGVAAVINAGGGGGAGGPRSTDGDAGGGGGGSGGMIWLEAPRVIGLSAALVANGGGGGEGSSDEQAGRQGDDAALSEVAATGGNGGSINGANGGNGGSLVIVEGQVPALAGPGGGGGGGGGVGFIRVVSPDVMIGLFSPARTN